MTELKRTLIETYLPVDEISKEAKKEKTGRAPTFEMHFWWTRKPLITARAAVLGSMLPADFDSQEFKKLLGLEHVKTTGKRAHNYDIHAERLEQLKLDYKKVWCKAPTIVDPFAGGGSIPFEAMRVGVDAVANDYNPLAHLIQRATIEYPMKYGKKLLNDVKDGLEWIFLETKNEMEQYYPQHDGKDVSAYIWAWSVKCPKCGLDTPLVGQWWLFKKADKNNAKKVDDNIFINPTVENQKILLEIKTGDCLIEGTCSDATGKCLNPDCGVTISRESMMYQADELPGAFQSWKDYRDYLIESSPMEEAHRERLKKRFSKQPEVDSIHRQQCRQVLLCDYENNLPVNTQAMKKEELRAKWWNVL